MKHKADRETSFINKEVSLWLEANRETNGLCLQRFHADFEISFANIPADNIVGIDGKQYQILSIGKRCFPECELLKETGQPCPLKNGVAFGKSLKE